MHLIKHFRSVIRLAAVVGLLFVSTASSYAGGPWARRADAGFLQFGVTWLGYDLAYDPEGEKIELGRSITDLTFQLYGEYGISDRLTVLLNLPMKVYDVSEPEDAFPQLAGGTAVGAENLSVGALYQLMSRNGFIISGKLFVGLPLATRHAQTGLRTGFRAFQITPQFSAGYSRGRWYGFLEPGATLMTDGLSQVLRLDAELGYNVWKDRTWVALTLNVWHSLRDGTERQSTLLSAATYQHERRFYGFGIKAIQKIHGPIGASLGAFGGFLNRAAPAAAVVSGGIFYEWE